MNASPCPICTASASSGPLMGGTDRWYDCERCGNFHLLIGVAAELKAMDLSERAKLSGYVRDQTDIRLVPMLTSDEISRIRQLRPISVVERIDRLLRWAVFHQEALGGDFSIGQPDLIAKTHSRNQGEVNELADHLEKRGLLSLITADGLYSVTTYGFIESESEKLATASRSAFIAMWFDKSMQLARRDGLELAVRNAGYTPVIVDQVHHIGKIDDEIIAQIRKAKFLVADFTGHRGGVYFEAGFALGLGIPVFWTCRSDDFKELHFDIRQYNCIMWDTPEDLQSKLRNRIEAILGTGPIRIQ